MSELSLSISNVRKCYEEVFLKISLLYYGITANTLLKKNETGCYLDKVKV